MTNKTYTKETMPEKFTMDVCGKQYTGIYDKDTDVFKVFLDDSPHLEYEYDLEFAKAYIERGSWVITPEQDESPDSSTALPEKWKINVEDFAKENDITLEDAHTIVQKWLFSQGLSWNDSYNPQEVKYMSTKFITNTYLDTGQTSEGILYGHQSFKRNLATEVKLKLKLDVSIASIVTPIETIEYNGLKYNKQAFEEAIRKAIRKDGLEPLE